MNNGKSSTGFYTMGILALFMAGFLLIVIFGANIYKGTVETQDANNNTRAILSCISSFSKSQDPGHIKVASDNKLGAVLIVEDGDTGYAQKVYEYKGNLVQEYSKEDSALFPEEARVIGKTDTFTIEEKAAGMIAVDTDAGQVLIHTGEKEAGGR
ncbi:MAG: DUF4860 domain-containing protein [Firmicutes bacterium]|nr:DUF4860 domain-containing protein [Bacillota bacterium]MBR2511756.1 DUF4860 domain-containing protein [Bacillota bacterium]